MSFKEEEPQAERSEAPLPPLASSALPPWRRWLPLLIAVGLVAFVLYRIDWAVFLEQIVAVDYPSFLSLMALFLLTLLSADTLASLYIYRQAAPAMSYRELFIARGASYLPAMLNHHVGQAWLTYFMAKSFRVDLGRMAGATLLVYASWGGCVLGLAAVAVLASPMSSTWLVVPLGAGIAYLLLLAVKPRALRDNRVLGPLFEAGIRGHLVAMAFRLPHIAVLFLGTWLPFWFFAVPIPWSVALVYVPILMVAVTLPITPQGLGTRDALAAAFFAPFALADSQDDKLAIIAAATTTTAAVIILFGSLIGLLLMRKAMSMIPNPPSRDADKG